MDRLQLATLLSWAGDAGFEGRKRLQKVVFFLQHAGCQLDCQYTLHHFGPYSRDVADTCDEMVTAGLIVESGGPAAATSYTYKLAPTTCAHLANAPHAAMQKFQSLGKSLISEKIWPLELGSTILYFYDQTRDWDEAHTKACSYKRVSPDDLSSSAGLALAKRVKSTRV